MDCGGGSHADGDGLGGDGGGGASMVVDFEVRMVEALEVVLISLMVMVLEFVLQAFDWARYTT